MAKKLLSKAKAREYMFQIARKLEKVAMDTRDLPPAEYKQLILMAMEARKFGYRKLR
jgi:hypothetical protein